MEQSQAPVLVAVGRSGYVIRFAKSVDSVTFGTMQRAWRNGCSVDEIAESFGGVLDEVPPGGLLVVDDDAVVMTIGCDCD